MTPLASAKLEKVNKQIQRLVAEILRTQVDLDAETLVTVAAVETAANLRATTVWLSVYPPEQGASVLERLSGQMYDLQGTLNQALQWKHVPRVHIKLLPDGQRS